MGIESTTALATPTRENAWNSAAVAAGPRCSINPDRCIRDPLRHNINFPSTLVTITKKTTYEEVCWIAPGDVIIWKVYQGLNNSGSKRLFGVHGQTRQSLQAGPTCINSDEILNKAWCQYILTRGQVLVGYFPSDSWAP